MQLPKFYFFIFLILFSFSCSDTGEKKTVLKIAVAANVQPALEKIAALFEKEQDIKIEIISASSGKLVSQIYQHAPFDIFLSADMDYPAQLYEKGFTKESPKVYSRGILVIWAKKPELLKNIAGKEIKKIAIAQPDLAPYGKKAVEYLKEEGIYGKIESKLVFAESISQVNQYILSEVVDIAFTSNSACHIPEIKEKGIWKTLDKEIPHGLVVLNYGQENHPVECRLFEEFIFSKKAQDIFKEFGYKNP